MSAPEFIASPTLYLAQEFEGPNCHSLGLGEVCVFTARAPGKESENEDSALIYPLSPTGGVVAVADGIGGHRAGARASEAALRAMASALLGAKDADGWREAILTGFERANTAVVDLGLGAGTTLVVVEILEHRIRVYHVGDSSVLVTGQRGSIKLQTVGHSPTDYAVEAGFLEEHEALHHAERHIILNAVGSGDMRVEMGSWLDLNPRDTLLAASDGLLDNMMTSEVVELVRKGPLDESADALALECRERMVVSVGDSVCRPDDLTLLLYRPTRR